MVLRETLLLLLGCCCCCLETSLHGWASVQGTVQLNAAPWRSRGLTGTAHSHLLWEHTWSLAAGCRATSWRGRGGIQGEGQSRPEESSSCSSWKNISIPISDIVWTWLASPAVPDYAVLQVVLQLGKCSSLPWHCHNKHQKKPDKQWSCAILWVWKRKSYNYFINYFGQWVGNNSREFTITRLSFCLYTILFARIMVTISFTLCNAVTLRLAMFWFGHSLLHCLGKQQK